MNDLKRARIWKRNSLIAARQNYSFVVVQRIGLSRVGSASVLRVGKYTIFAGPSDRTETPDSVESGSDFISRVRIPLYPRPGRSAQTRA